MAADEKRLVEVVRIILLNAEFKICIAAPHFGLACPCRERVIQPVARHDVPKSRSAKAGIRELACKGREIARRHSADLEKHASVRQRLLIRELGQPHDIAATVNFLRLRELIEPRYLSEVAAMPHGRDRLQDTAGDADNLAVDADAGDELPGDRSVASFASGNVGRRLSFIVAD